jgi:PAS domain-containing protein
VLSRHRTAFLIACTLVAAAGFGAVAGLVVRAGAEPPGVREARLAREQASAHLHSLRAALWELGTAAAGETAERWDQSVPRAADAVFSVAADAPGAAGDGARHVAGLARELAVDFARLAREAPETAALVRRELVRTVIDTDQLVARGLVGLAQDRGHERVLEEFRRRSLGWVTWLFVVPTLAVVGIVWAGRPGGGSVGDQGASAPAPAAPPPEPEGLAFLERTFQPGADPVLAATSSDAAPVPSALLDGLLAAAGWVLILLEAQPGEDARILWHGSDTRLLGGEGTLLAGRTLPELFPAQADALRAALASTADGSSRRSEVNLGTRDKPQVCELLLATTPGSLPRRSLCALRPLGGERALTIEVEQMRVKIARAEERSKDIAQAKKQTEEKRRDFITASGALPIEFELKPDNQSIVITDLTQPVADLHGATLDAFFGDGNLLFKHVIPPDRPRVIEALQRAAGETAMLDVRYGIALATGAEKWLRLRALPHKTAQNWTRFTALIWDETEGHVEEEKRDRRQRVLEVLEALAARETAPWLGIDRGAKDQVVFANAAASSHFGFDAAELLQVQIGNLDGGFLEAAQTVPPDAATFSLPGVHETANGPVNVHVDYVRTPDGRLLGARIQPVIGP